MRRHTVAAVLASVAAAIHVMAGSAQQRPDAGVQELGPPIRLQAGTFVPTRGERPSIPPGLTIAGYAQGQRGYYLVQFAGPILETWKNDLASIGAEILDYIPDFAFKVRMTPAEAARAANRPGVAWVGLFHPAYKFNPDMPRNGPRLYVVRIERGVSVAATAAEIAGTGAQIVEGSGSVLSVAASGAQVIAIARVLNVASIEELRIREKHNDHAAGRIVGSYEANAAGYDGSTQIVAIADTGLGNGVTADAHPDLAGRVAALHNWPGANTTCYSVTNDGAVDVDSGHGTHVALSALGGSGNIGRGSAPAARLIFQAVENWARMKGMCSILYPSGYYLVGIPSDIRQLFQQAYNGGARVHSNSWGSNASGAYTLDSVNADSFVWMNRDMTIAFSAGNAGTDANGDGIIDFDSIGSPATAKNVITVGASENDRTGDWACDSTLAYTDCAGQSGQNTIFTYGAAWPGNYPKDPIKSDPSAGNMEQMAAFSSRGPTDDGRIKPDVVAPGTWIVSGYSDRFQQGYDASANPQNGAWQYDGWGFPRSQYHKYMGGTSMSTPIVAGGAAVVRDYYQKKHGHVASAALVKANLINSAVDLLDENNDGNYDNAHPIPNMHEGWGRVDLAAAVRAHQFVESTQGLATGGNASFEYVVPGGSPFKVTLVWTDYPSTETAVRNLVNDLDLVVTGPGGTPVYRGNVFSGGWSATGNSADRVNNVENVYVQSAVSGAWVVQVIGFNVPNGPQPFALVVRDGSSGGGAPAPNTAPTAANQAVTTDENTAVTVTLSGSDPEQCDLTFSIVAGPTSGTLGAIDDQACVSGSPNSDTARITYYPGAPGTDSFTYVVSDGTAQSNVATVTITVASSDPPVEPVGSSHVGDLDAASVNLGKGYWRGSVTIEVHDSNHKEVSGATVSGSWSGSFSGSAECTTGPGGRCSVSTGDIHNSAQAATWTVTGVDASLPYQANDNHDPDGDSDGSSITVRK